MWGSFSRAARSAPWRRAEDASGTYGLVAATSCVIDQSEGNFVFLCFLIRIFILFIISIISFRCAAIRRLRFFWANLDGVSKKETSLRAPQPMPGPIESKR